MQPPVDPPGDLPDVVDPSDADRSAVLREPTAGVHVQDMLVDTLRALLNAAGGSVHVLGRLI